MTAHSGFGFFPSRLSKTKAPKRKDMPFAVYATLWLNPNLSHDNARALTKLLAASERHVFEGDAPIVRAGQAPDRVHLIVSGMVRMVRPGSATRPTEVLCHFRDGQWIGVPYLVRSALTELAPEVRAHIEPTPNFEIRPLGTVETASIAIEDLLPLMSEDRAFAIHMAAQLCHRAQMLDEWVDAAQALSRHIPEVDLRMRTRFARFVADHSLLGQLEDADRELLLQNMAPFHQHNESDTAWMTAKAANGKIGMIIDGNAHAYLPGDAGAFVGTFDAGSLVGFEHIATNTELAKRDVRSDAAAIDPMETAEPSRQTVVYLAPGTSVAQFDWRAIRWMLYEKKHLWARVMAFIRPGPVSQPRPPATVYAFYGLEATLGTSVLAQGAAIALARQIATDDDRKHELAGTTPEPGLMAPEVCLIDLKDTHELMCDLHEGEPALIEEVLDIEGDLVDGDDDNFLYGTRTYKVGQRATLLVAWTNDVNDTDKLVELQRQQGEKQTIILAADIRAIEELPTLGESWRGGVSPEVAVMLARRINRIASHVVWLTDDPYAGYDITEEVPRSIIRAEIMNRAYRARERHRALQVLRTWWQMAPGQGDGLPEVELEDSDDAMRQVFPKQPMQKARHLLRVPHEPEEDESLFNRGIDEIFADRGNEMVKTFERLVRMIQGRTVGVALGGGGAWGFSHVALMRALERCDVPVDYVGGTSFGSVVAGLYGAGGMAALDKLLEWSDSEAARAVPPSEQPEKSGGILGALRGIKKTWRNSQLTRRVNSALITSRFLQTMIDDMLAETLDDDIIPLTTTPIPFLPITTNVTEGRDEIIYHGTVGHGVRSASCLPPVFSPLITGDERFIDGAMVAFVPAHKVREWGADFVIASNVIPPNADYKSLVDHAIGHASHSDEMQARMKMDRDLKRALNDAMEGKAGAAAEYRRLTTIARGMPQRSAAAMALISPVRTAQRVVDDLLIRVLDTIHGFYLMSWKAGEDQGKRHANYILDMRPADYQVFQFWRGNEIAGRYEKLFLKENIGEHIRKVWEQPHIWDDIDSHHVSVEIVND